MDRPRILTDDERKEHRKLTCRKYDKNHPQIMRDKSKRWRLNNREKYLKQKKKYRLKYEYGLTELELELMLKPQGNKYAVCHQEFGKRGPQVDHNHKTGKVRALLCSSCNIMLGMAKDNADILRYAIQYLENKTNKNIQGV